MARGDPLLPPGWRTRRTVTGWVATGPSGPAAGVPPRIEWRAGAPPAYDALDVEDEDYFELDGRWVGYRRFGHRADDVELVSEEWTWDVDGGCRVLTGTVPREDYLEVCDLFDDVACSMDPFS